MIVGLVLDVKLRWVEDGKSLHERFVPGGGAVHGLSWGDT